MTGLATMKPYIRRVERRDLPALGRALCGRYLYKDRIRRQSVGLGQLLAAFWPDDSSPIGVVYLWTEPAEEPDLRQRMPGVPLLMHLTVKNEMRGQGVGKSLVERAEEILRLDGHKQVALGVEPRNLKAIALYEKLGYQHSDLGIIDTCHVEFRKRRQRRYPETCRIMVKSLVEEAGFWPHAYTIGPFSCA